MKGFAKRLTTLILAAALVLAFMPVMQFGLADRKGSCGQNDAPGQLWQLGLAPDEAKAAGEIPNVNITGGKLTFDAVYGADYYDLQIDSCHSEIYYCCNILASDTPVDLNAICEKNGFSTGYCIVRLTAMKSGEAYSETWQTAAYLFKVAGHDPVTITFDPNGGSGDMDDYLAKWHPATKEYFILPDGTLTPPAGKIFVAWMIDGKYYFPNEKYMPTGDTTIKAIWAGPMENVKISATGKMTWNAVPGAKIYYLEIGAFGTLVEKNEADLFQICKDNGLPKKVAQTVTLEAYSDYAYNRGVQMSTVWTGSYKYQKAKNTLKVSAKTAKVKYAKLKKKNQTIKRSKAMTVKKAQGKVTYKKVSVSKKKYAKKFTVSKKTGKITVKKGLKKGTYKVRIKVTAAGTSRYNKGAKTVTVKVKVK